MTNKNRERREKSKATVSNGAGIVIMYAGLEVLSNGDYVYGSVLIVIGLAMLYISKEYNFRVPKEHANEVMEATEDMIDRVSRRLEAGGDE